MSDLDNCSPFIKLELNTSAYTLSLRTLVLTSPIDEESLLLEITKVKNIQHVVTPPSLYSESSSRFNVIMVKNDEKIVSYGNKLIQ